MSQKRLYLNDIFFLMKLVDVVYFVSDVEDISETVHPDDLPFISRGFGIELEVLEDFYYN